MFPFPPAQELPRMIAANTIDQIFFAFTCFAAAAFATRGHIWNRPDPRRKILFDIPQLQNEDRTALDRRSHVRDIAEKMKELDVQVVIVFGSQSGTAEEFARRLARGLYTRFGQKALVADASDYDPRSLSNIAKTCLALFVLATYGEGDPCDNCIELVDWLNHSDGASLSNLQYSAFGLGNSNYKFYNRVVDVVTAAFDAMGAKSVLCTGKANEAAGTSEEDFLSWKETLEQYLVEHRGWTMGNSVYQPSLKLAEARSIDTATIHQGERLSAKNNDKRSPTISSMGAISVLEARPISKVTTRQCLHLEFDINKTWELSYKTGDHLAVWPINASLEVERLVQVLGVADRMFVPMTIESTDPAIASKVPSPTTLEALFRHYLEIGSPVHRDLALGLAQYAPSEQARKVLTAIGTSRSLYQRLAEQKHLNLGRLMEHASPAEVWTGVPLSYIIEVLPTMRPRYYSISSSSSVSPRRLAITVGTADSPLPAANYEEKVHGLTSNYLFALGRGKTGGEVKAPTYDLLGPGGVLQGNQVYAQVRRSKFKLPARCECPLVMIAAGTGIAPFRAFLMERCKMLQLGRPVGRMLLFFGCRSPDQDLYYNSELQEMLKQLQGCLEIVFAFSRMPGKAKMYVQDRIAEASKNVVQLLNEEGATLYICGKSAMARSVETAVEAAFKDEKQWCHKQWDEFVAVLKRQNKWLEDVWG